ncbi:MAG: nitroreductase family protein [Oscillospiraceae bacterium]|jgi:nitroreductase|nr:nitroreductase family protein [Oscillospiraceae bacterium]
MDFMDCVQERRSVRKFKNDAVSSDVLKKIVQAASFAPSWKNSQTTRYIAVTDPALKKELAEKCVIDFAPNTNTMLGAPALVLVTTVSPRSGFERDGSPSTSKGTHWESFDAGIATQTFCLAAHNEGLATVVLGIFDEAKVIETAHVPEGQKVSAILAVGYADETPVMPKRKSVDELLSFMA